VTARRRRGFLLVSVALASGGLAASRVHERERNVAERVGPTVEVLVAARDLRAGSRISRGALALRPVPARFVPPDALASAAGVAGARTAVRVAAGGYVTASVLAGPNDRQRGGAGVGRGERAVTVEVVSVGALDASASGTRVDVLVSTESGTGAGRTVMALAGAELLRVESAGVGAAYAGDADGDRGTGGVAGGSSAPTALATLRVTLRQAVYLTAADNFAREIRLLARPSGDRSSAGAAVSQGQL
jgi:pilus assembly protein CpaB